MLSVVKNTPRPTLLVVRVCAGCGGTPLCLVAGPLFKIKLLRFRDSNLLKLFDQSCYIYILGGYCRANSNFYSSARLSTEAQANSKFERRNHKQWMIVVPFSYNFLYQIMYLNYMLF